MKRLLPLFFSIVIGVFMLPSLLGQTQDSTCTISENYSEAVSENITNQLRVFVFLGDDGLWDGDIDSINLTFAQMVSIRDYYEDARTTLPDCAQELNSAYLRVTTAITDVLAYNWAIQANEDRTTYFTSRANTAKDNLDEQWSILSEIDSGSVFETE